MPDFYFNTATTGTANYRFPQWGRAFWQDSNDGEFFMAFASGDTSLVYIRSSDSGVTWSQPSQIASVDTFTTHNNFDTFMDPRGHVHCAFRLNGSGCYKLMGKVPGGGWTATSGETQPTAFNDAADSGVIRGFNGSIHVMEAPGGFTGEVSAKFPLVRIASKCITPTGDFVKSWYLGDPYKGNFTVEEIGAVSTGPLGGGFAMGYSESANAGYGVVFYSPLAGAIVSREKSGFGGAWTVGSTFGAGVDAGTIILQNGQIPFSPNMAIGSGGYRKFNALAFVASQSGNDFWGARELSGTTVYSRLDGIIKANTSNASDGFLPWSGVVPSSGIYGVGYNFPGSGTNLDLSFDHNGNTILYFQNLDFMGRQVITRMMTRAQRNSVVSTELLASDFYAYPSGGRNMAQASHSTTGGFANRVFYNGFKACRHSKGPGVGTAYKAQYIATQGYVSQYPSGSMITVWDAEKSPEVVTPFTIPYLQMDYTPTSGTATQRFVGVSNQTNWTASTIASCFDGSPSLTFGQVTNGGSLTLQLDKPRVVDRIEIVGASSSSSLAVGSVNPRDIGTITVQASFDNINYSTVGVIPSGNSNTNSRLRALTTNREVIDAQGDGPAGEHHIHFFNAISARYIRLNWATQYASTARRIGEIRVFGPATTTAETTTFDHIYTVQPIDRMTYTERFITQKGSLPGGWTSNGDFTWYVVASGEATRTNSQSLGDDADGMVPSGLFKFLGDSNGNGDGFALISEPSTDTSGLLTHVGPIPANGIAPGNSGVVEVIVSVPSNEQYAPGSNGRRISFDYRIDPHSQDEFEFYTVDNPIFAPTGVRRLFNQGVTTDWTTNTYYLQTGDTILRWVYTRKGPVSTYGYGAAWIDNVVGLTGPPRNSSHGFLVGVANFESGVINAYMKGNYFDAINAFMSGEPLSSRINAYLLSDIHADATSSINGYIYGYPDAYINGFMLGGSGELTYPTGGIHGYLMAPLSGSGPSTIYGYLEGDWGQEIYGYMVGYEPAALSGAEINGYLKTLDDTSYINAVIGSPSTVIPGAINAFLESRFGSDDQIIHGYLLAPDGTTDGINAYSQGWNANGDFVIGPQSVIHGYIYGDDELFDTIHAYALAQYPNNSIHAYMGTEALVASGGGSVGGGPGDGSTSTSNVTAGTNWVWATLKGYEGDQAIHAYLMAPPGFYNDINGYMFSGSDQNEIWGTLTGHQDVGSGIYGYASGIGFGSSSIHGFLNGVSGIGNESIYGILTGALISDSYILATMIGSTTGVSRSQCLSHNYPLQAVPTVTIPTSFFNP